jgi:hypothetical protein
MPEKVLIRQRYPFELDDGIVGQGYCTPRMSWGCCLGSRIGMGWIEEGRGVCGRARIRSFVEGSRYGYRCSVVSEVIIGGGYETSGDE